MICVATAERAGGAGPSEDRIFTTANAVIVLDGASQLRSARRNGGWMADSLGLEVQQRLTAEPTVDLRAALHDAIAAVAAGHDLTPGHAPSTTVSIVRWSGGELDALVLCDSPVIAVRRSGEIEEVRDERLTQLSDRLVRPDTYQTEDPEAWSAFVDQQRQHRNQPDGYWVAEAEPRAAHHAEARHWSLDELKTVLVMTDGVSSGIDNYGTPADWHTAFRLAERNPAYLVDLIHESEEGDPHATRWPRSKCHDDKALAVIQLGATTSRWP